MKSLYDEHGQFVHPITQEFGEAIRPHIEAMFKEAQKLDVSFREASGFISADVHMTEAMIAIFGGYEEYFSKTMRG